MAALLLNPRVWIAVIVLGVIVGMHLRIDALKAKVAEDQSAIIQLQANIAALTTAAASKAVALDECGDNLNDIRTAYEGMKKAAEQTGVYRKKWQEATRELAESPPPTDDEQCLSGGKIDEKHKAILAAAIAAYNAAVMRKEVRYPGAVGGGEAATPVLPEAGGATH